MQAKTLAFNHDVAKDATPSKAGRSRRSNLIICKEIASAFGIAMRSIDLAQ